MVVGNLEAGRLPVGPGRPRVTAPDIWRQFWIDVTDKEVQSASTYTHHWVANQFGHVFVGAVVGGLGTLVARYVVPYLLPASLSTVCGSTVALIGVALWEYKSYRKALRDAGDLFPAGRQLLRDNAIIAAGYMALGVLLVCGYRQLAEAEVEWFGLGTELLGAILFVALTLTGMGFATYWLCQKIVLQKAGLPYLSRLSNAPATIPGDVAKQLVTLIDSPAPPEGEPRQVVIAGPIGSGRTAIAVAVGTEFAFKDAKVRYLSLASLLEFAAQPRRPNYADDSGPPNIDYWRWSQAQVVIIDDIGPLLAAKAQQRELQLEQFQQILGDLRPIREVLAQCHTVWVIGDLRPDARVAMPDASLADLASEIASFCGGKQRPLMVQLDRGDEPKATARLV